MSKLRTGTTIGGSLVWHAGNDGPGSGLNADTVDGIEGANFLRSDVADTAAGAMTFSAGISVTGNITATGDITAFYSSDSRLKENVRNIENPIEKVKALNGYNFDWTDAHLESVGGVDDYNIRKADVGVIAQELQNVLPELVAERENGLLAVKYDRIVALLIEVVKEQQKQIDELKTINS